MKGDRAVFENKVSIRSVWVLYIINRVGFKIISGSQSIFRSLKKRSPRGEVGHYRDAIDGH